MPQEGEILEFPLGAQWKWIWLASMRTQVQSLVSLSGLRIWHGCELWCRLPVCLRSGIAVAQQEAPQTAFAGVGVQVLSHDSMKWSAPTDLRVASRVGGAQVNSSGRDSCLESTAPTDSKPLWHVSWDNLSSLLDSQRRGRIMSKQPGYRPQRPQDLTEAGFLETVRAPLWWQGWV